MTLASYLILYNSEVLWHSGSVRFADLVSLFMLVPGTFQWYDLICILG
jgi:hypothetical protein